MTLSHGEKQIGTGVYFHWLHRRGVIIADGQIVELTPRETAIVKKLVVSTKVAEYTPRIYLCSKSVEMTSGGALAVHITKLRQKLVGTRVGIKTASKLGHMMYAIPKR